MEQTQTRDFQTEVTELFSQRPELKDSLLPDEVARDCAAREVFTPQAACG